VSHLHLAFFFFWLNWVELRASQLKSRSSLPFEPHLQFTLLQLFWRWVWGGLSQELFALAGFKLQPSQSQPPRITGVSHQHLAVPKHP
jgi:hypothetical protein